MEEYPEELRTPPIPLITLVGYPELHSTISTHLHSLKPPINTLALPDFDKISVLAKRHKNSSDSSSSSFGFLKREWLLKHRSKIPSVIVALFGSDRISGDYVHLSSILDHIKSVISTRNTKLVVMLVQSSPEDVMNEDRMSALCKRAELDSKYIINFSVRDTSEVKQSLNRLGSVLADLVHIYYRDEGRRVRARVEKRNYNSAELGIRYCFKVAVYAEFRRDWVEALKFYEDAYHALKEMVGTSTRLPPIQRLVEIKTLAEQLHFKISTLLLHGGKLVEAVLWFRQHCTFYKKLVGVDEVTFLHWEWLSRQFLVFAELLETSSKNIPGFSALVMGVKDQSLSECELQPAYYYQLAALYLIDKRSCLELSLSMSEVINDNDTTESVIPSSYIGQFSRLLEQVHEEVALQPLTDEEFVRYCISEGKRFQDSYEIIALLKKSYEIYTSLNVPRMATYCSFQIAREYFTLNEIKNAKQYFNSALTLYRQESWSTLLWEVLGYLRECSKLDGSLKEFVEYSLEMASLPVKTEDSSTYKECGPAGPPCFEEREKIHKEVMSLIFGESEFTTKNDDKNFRVSKGSPLHIEIDLVSPLRVVLLASFTFHEQVVKPGVYTQITLSLLSQLPLPFEIDSIDVQFNQSECNFSIQSSQNVSKSLSNKEGSRVETASNLSLSTNKWLRLTFDVKSDRSGKLECISIVVRIGSHFTICCRAESPASMDDLPLYKFENLVESFPTKDPALSFSGQKTIQVEEPDSQVDLSVDGEGPALIGENFIVPVTVSSKGHSVYSGELKINLVDTRGGGLVSPREYEPSSTESHHVELLKVSGFDDEKYIASSDNIRNIQHSFGLVSVPFLNIGESWSCKLEIKWHRPKPIMLFVSLSYSSQPSQDVNTRKIHVHKSLQIEGHTPISITHQMMLPFRRDALLLSSFKSTANTEKFPLLPLDETSILVVSAKNSTEVPLRVLSMTIEDDDSTIEKNSCRVHPASNEDVNKGGSYIVGPNEEYKKVFSVIPVGPTPNTSKVKIGTVCLEWMRDAGPTKPGISRVLTKYKLPEANVEPSPLTVNLKCPPHAVLGNPFTYFITIQNQTDLLQEIKYSLQDSQSFVSSGSHNDTIFVLPKSEHVLSYKLVPLASGPQQLPRVTVTSLRYSASFQPSVSASTIFVFPVKPQFEIKTAEKLAESTILASEQISC